MLETIFLMIQAISYKKEHYIFLQAEDTTII